MATLETFDLDRWLEVSGALKTGHFQLSSGSHSPLYVQCALLLEDPERAARLGVMLAVKLKAFGIDSVLSPALGGVIIGHEVASALATPFRFVERVEGEMRLRRGFSIDHGERIVIVEDVVTTGRSSLEAAATAEGLGGEICAVASILDRTPAENPFKVPFVSLKALNLPTFEPASCPLCAAGEKIVKPGSRPDS